MNANDTWKQYNTFHKRKTAQHTPGVYKALQAQLKYFAETRDIEGIPFIPVAEQLKNIYVDTGPLWAFQTYINVMRDAGLKKHYRPAISLKRRMPIGFNESFINAMLEFYRVDFLNTADDITQTSKDYIRQSITRGLQKGEDLDFIIDQILKDGFTKKRAALIARTEVMKASNHGEQLGTDKTGLETRKEWLSVRDHRTRRDHVAADGQTVEDGAPFHIGTENYLMQRPGASKGTDGRTIPAKEICNCRCTVGRHVLRDSDGLPMLKPGI